MCSQDAQLGVGTALQRFWAECFSVEYLMMLRTHRVVMQTHNFRSFQYANACRTVSLVLICVA
jgi:hypothetical protein